MSTTKALSTTGLPDPKKFYKKPLHRRNDSGELDVFEAATYFSGTTEFTGFKGGRMSLEMPTRNSSLSSENQVVEKPIIMKEKKNHKQPNSPGGRLASFLNSLFNQTSSKKKKPKPTTTQSMKDHESDDQSRRKRRSSISHFGGAPIADPKPNFPSSNSGFRTPPPYGINPTTTKACEDLKSYSDHKPIALQKDVFGDGRNIEFPCLDGKLNSTNGFHEKFKNLGNGDLGKDGFWGEKYYQTEKKELKKSDEVDVDVDGAESDSSSDLFELENYDLGYCSSGLPVYETTHMDKIKIGAPISNGAM